jgi:hypothetical protein
MHLWKIETRSVCLTLNININSNEEKTLIQHETLNLPKEAKRESLQDTGIGSDIPSTTAIAQDILAIINK